MLKAGRFLEEATSQAESCRPSAVRVKGGAGGLQGGKEVQDPLRMQVCEEEAGRPRLLVWRHVFQASPAGSRAGRRTDGGRAPGRQ